MDISIPLLACGFSLLVVAVSSVRWHKRSKHMDALDAQRGAVIERLVADIEQTVREARG